VNDYVEVPYSASLNPDEFTVEAWVFVEGGVNTWRSVVTSRNNPPHQGYIIYASLYNRWEFWIGNGSGWVKLLGPSISLNTWYHLIALYSSGQLRLYVDTVLYGSLSETLSKNTTSPLRIGAGATEGSPRYFFKGIIDEVRIYNRALSETEISDLYNHYGYTTLNYAGRVLVRKRIDPEPSTSVGNEETSGAPIIIAQRRLLIIGI